MRPTRTGTVHATPARIERRVGLGAGRSRTMAACGSHHRYQAPRGHRAGRRVPGAARLTPTIADGLRRDGSTRSRCR